MNKQILFHFYHTPIFMSLSTAAWGNANLAFWPRIRYDEGSFIRIKMQAARRQGCSRPATLRYKGVQ
ncbi:MULTISPECIES: hypothetical protein [unclassified Clostridium]|jgi:hypothetical protein|uniref:hypothetical protein n=1 Tax=unclassified Clostridium TaxID=2614128 RepID=UPI001A9ABE45|nr:MULTISPECIES: hypothetical protein [unclassified Clostridium]